MTDLNKEELYLDLDNESADDDTNSVDILVRQGENLIIKKIPLDECIDWNDKVLKDIEEDRKLTDNREEVAVIGTGQNIPEVQRSTYAVNNEDDGLPSVISLDKYKDHVPKLSDELIQGVLRVGHKMLISGPSKAGKSFLLMELCIAIATGGEWLGFPCKKGRVFYINLEIDPNSCITRFLKIKK